MVAVEVAVGEAVDASVGVGVSVMIEGVRLAGDTEGEESMILVGVSVEIPGSGARLRAINPTQ